MRRVVVLASLVVSLVAWTIACAPADPVGDVLEQRARWEVLPVGTWVQDESGAVLISVRLSGPARSSLDRLTVRVALTAEDGDAHERWHTFDMTGIERGGPADRLVRLPDLPPIDTLEIDTVPAPTDAEREHIEELAGLGES